MKKITPLLTVDAIEPILPFWTEGLGFTVAATVPHPPDDPDGPLGFVILEHDGIELMFQLKASVEADLGQRADPDGPQLAEAMSQGLTTLFAEVESVDAVLDRLTRPTVAVPRRRTFYGMDEIFLIAPGGVLLGLAARVEEEGEADPG